MPKDNKAGRTGTYRRCSAFIRHFETADIICGMEDDNYTGIFAIVEQAPFNY